MINTDIRNIKELKNELMKYRRAKAYTLLREVWKVNIGKVEGAISFYDVVKIGRARYTKLVTGADYSVRLKSVSDRFSSMTGINPEILTGKAFLNLSSTDRYKIGSDLKKVALTSFEAKSYANLLNALKNIDTNKWKGFLKFEYCKNLLDTTGKYDHLHLDDEYLNEETVEKIIEYYSDTNNRNIDIGALMKEQGECQYSYLDILMYAYWNHKQEKYIDDNDVDVIIYNDKTAHGIMRQIDFELKKLQTSYAECSELGKINGYFKSLRTDEGIKEYLKHILYYSSLIGINELEKIDIDAVEKYYNKISEHVQLLSTYIKYTKYKQKYKK